MRHREAKKDIWTDATLRFPPIFLFFFSKWKPARWERGGSCSRVLTQTEEICLHYSFFKCPVASQCGSQWHTPARLTVKVFGGMRGIKLVLWENPPPRPKSPRADIISSSGVHWTGFIVGNKVESHNVHKVMFMQIQLYLLSLPRREERGEEGIWTGLFL